MARKLNTAASRPGTWADAEVADASKPRAPEAVRRVADDGGLREIVDGLSREQKELPSKHFYDRRGSELFERITELPEYYLTRTEQALLERWIPAWVEELRPGAVVELGAGSAAKTETILREAAHHRRPLTYLPVDVSEEFLRETADRISQRFPGIAVRPVVADMTRPFTLPAALAGPVLHLFLGSTIGNFATPGAVALLSGIRGRLGDGDAFLLGVDLRKEPAVIERAYNDSEGVTAAFNLNLLTVVNQRFGADFDTDAFTHRAFYDGTQHRIEMHLVARADQTVTIPDGGSWTIRSGETIRTEISCKYDRPSVEAMLDAAGLALHRWAADDEGRFAIMLTRSLRER